MKNTGELKKSWTVSSLIILFLIIFVLILLALLFGGPESQNESDQAIYNEAFLNLSHSSLEEYQKILIYLKSTPNATYSTYLTQRYPWAYNEYVAHNVKMSYLEYLEKYESAYVFDTYGGNVDYFRLSFSEISEDDLRSHTHIAYMPEDVVNNLPVLKEYLYGELPFKPIRASKEDIDALSDYWYSTPFEWNGTWYRLRASKP